MRTYIEIVDNLSLLLNHNGRQKAGMDLKKEVLSCISELKQNFNITISKKFLFDLMETNLTEEQKRKKLRNLFVGVKTTKQTRDLRFLDLIKSRVEIKDFSHNAKMEFITKKAHRNRQVNSIKLKNNSFNNIVFDYSNQDELRDNGIFLNESAYINLDSHEQQVGKEFIRTKKETYTFINA